MRAALVLLALFCTCASAALLTFTIDNMTRATLAIGQAQLTNGNWQSSTCGDGGTINEYSNCQASVNPESSYSNVTLTYSLQGVGNIVVRVTVDPSGQYPVPSVQIINPNPQIWTNSSAVATSPTTCAACVALCSQSHCPNCV